MILDKWLILKKYTMKTLTLSICALFLSILSIFSQTKISSLTANNNKLHNLNIEKFYLHTNKTSYLAGENIWFKAYVVNDTDKKLSDHTTNLHINIYDSNKELILSNLFHVDNGVAYGEIELSSSLKTGLYYIELTTQWNQNFDDNSYLTKVEIIGSSGSSKITSRVKNSSVAKSQPIDSVGSSKVEISFHPESGVLLENIENNISYSVTLDGLPSSLSAEIIDESTGIIVAQLEPNNFGMGTFTLYCRPGRKYSAHLKHENLDYKFPIHTAASYGYVIEKDEKQITNNALNFTVKTNENTIKSVSGKYLYAVLHRKGRQKLIVPIKLKKKYINYSFPIKDSILFEGVNSIALFNENNQEVADYAFFHDTDFKTDLEISSSINNDSIDLNIKLLNTTASVNSSISILPINTKVHDFKSSVVSALLLAPYLENKQLDLDNILESSNRNQDIQTLLNVCKKSNSFPYTRKPHYYKDAIIEEDHGIRISGNVSANVKDLTGYRVMLSSIKNELLLVQDIGDSNSFEFNNLYLSNDHIDYKLALLDPQGKVIKSGFRIKENYVNYKPNDILNSKLNYLTTTPKPELKKVEEMVLLSGMNVLDEVEIINFEKREKEIEAIGLDPDILDNGFADIHIIEEGNYAYDVYMYLQRLPNIRVKGDRYLGYNIVSVRGMRMGKMAIRVDGIFYWDSDILIARRIDEFAAISINPSGAGGGIFGQGGIISFYTRGSKFGPDGSILNPDLVASKIDLGFNKSSSAYESDLWNFPNEEFRESYGTIDWIPNFNINPETNNLLSVKANKYENLLVIIRGISEDGKIISEVKRFSQHSN